MALWIAQLESEPKQTQSLPAFSQASLTAQMSENCHGKDNIRENQW